MNKSRSKGEDQRCYASIPFRALSDPQCKRSHIAVLGVIAAHDRFSKNGRGCDAGRDRIAALANVNIAVVSRAIGELVNWKYITAETHSADGRRRIYRVSYTTEDQKAFAGNQEDPVRKVTPTSPITTDIGDAQITAIPKVGDIENPQVVVSLQEARNKIFPEREKIFPERGKRVPEGGLRKEGYILDVESYLGETPDPFDDCEWEASFG